MTKQTADALGEGIGAHERMLYCMSGWETSHATSTIKTTLNIQFLAVI
jgi:hypothetical protein